MHSGFPRFNSPDISAAGSAIEQPAQFIELFGIAHGVDLDAAVILIPDPAAEPDAAGVLFDKPAESHTLHAAGDEPGSGLDRRFHSAGAAASISASTADRNPLSENGLARRRKPFSTT